MNDEVRDSNDQTKQDDHRLPPSSRRFSRRRLLMQAGALAVFPVTALAYAHKIEPFWPRFPEIPIRIKGLPKSFENYRVAQITDMHAGHVPVDYLQRVMRQVHALKPDLVLFTGDLLHHDPRAIEPLKGLLRSFSAPVYASFGNHDYGVFRGEGEPYTPELSQLIHAACVEAGCTVLINNSAAINRGKDRLWLVGLDDLWFGDFNPELAFEAVPKNEPVIALSHNPDTAELLAPHHPDLILSGHTHGGQIRLPLYGAIRLNVAQPEYDAGLFQLPASQLFVSTGVGFILRLRFNCRPEVPIFRLTSAV